MTARVAALWRAQGDQFLADHHADVEADVARLREAVVEAPLLTLPHIDGEAIMERLRRLDAAAVERLAATRARAVIDLTGPEPVVRVPSEEDGEDRPEPAAVDPAWHECRRCHQYVDEELMVQTAGAKAGPLCMDCALVVAGVRRAR